MLPSRGSTAHWERVDSLSWPQRSIAFSGRSQEWLLIQTQGDTHADHTFLEDFLPNCARSTSYNGADKFGGKGSFKVFENFSGAEIKNVVHKYNQKCLML